jgi:KipI family sensor histidine kinase inhibitor
MNAFQICTTGDACVTIDFPPAIDEAIALRCAAIAQVIRERRVPAVYDVVPTFHTVAVHYDPRRIDHGSLAQILRECAEMADGSTAHDGRVIEVPVQYGGEWGPDLPAVAAFGKCTEDEVVRLHSNRVYRVLMLGFLPGFAYMGLVDDRIAAPRLATPRAHVPAGSVAIAGRQTAVYPLNSPGGWQLIGRTSVQPFAPERPDPFLFQPADRVRFVPA